MYVPGKSEKVGGVAFELDLEILMRQYNGDDDDNNWKRRRKNIAYLRIVNIAWHYAKYFTIGNYLFSNKI